MGVWGDCTWNSVCDGGLNMAGYLVKLTRLLPDGSRDFLNSVELQKIESAKRTAANWTRGSSDLYATIYDLMDYGKAYYQYHKGRKVAQANPGRKHLSGHVSAKAQRAYEDILSSERRYGRYKGREKEVAARTVRGMIRRGVLNPGNVKYVVYTDGGYGPPKNFEHLPEATRFADKIGVSFVNVISGSQTIRVYQKIGHHWKVASKSPLHNPSSEAAEISEGFHGRPPSETIDVEEEEQYTEELGVLGCLVELHITRDNGETSVKLRFPIPTDPKFEDGDEVYLAAPNKHQMEFVGGDQEIANIDEIAKHTDKQLVKLGCLDKIVYLTDKYHLDDSDGKEAEYVHKLGKKKMFGFSKKRTGRPEVIYDTVNQQLKLVGGTYSITDEGIIN